MNRAERRRLQRQGVKVEKEPMLNLKTSDFNSFVENAKADAKARATSAAIVEINRQLLEQEEKYSLDLDAMILWTLHKCYGFGKKRLEDFYRAMVEEHIRMRKFYEMNDTYPEQYKLREIGVDVAALNQEMIGKWGADYGL